MKVVWALTGAGVAAVLLTAAATAPVANQIVFSDVTAQAGIKFVHNAGKTGKKYLPETTRGRAPLLLHRCGRGWLD